MGLESVTKITDLVATNPIAGDDVGKGDDHLRNIKTAVLTLPTTKKTIAETDLTDADTSEDITVQTLTQFEKVTGVCIKHSAAFTGGGLTAMTVSVGTAANPTKYAPAHDIFQAVGDTVFMDMTGFSSDTMASGGHTIIARFTSTGANVADATAGSVDIWVVTNKMEG